MVDKAISKPNASGATYVNIYYSNSKYCDINLIYLYEFIVFYCFSYPILR